MPIAKVPWRQLERVVAPRLSLRPELNRKDCRPQPRLRSGYMSILGPFDHDQELLRLPWTRMIG